MGHACRLLPHGFFAALALAASAHASVVGPDVAAPEVRFQHGIAYASGGARSNERNAIRAMVRHFNVRLSVVLASTDEALSDVDVSAADDRGKPRLRMRTEGPLLYMRLLHGHYQTMVAYHSAMQIINVSAGMQPVDTVARLRTRPGPNEWLLCQRGCPRVGARPTAR